MLFFAFFLTKNKERAEDEMRWILRRSLRRRIIAMVALLVCPLVLSQVSVDVPAGQPETVVDVLHQFSDQADVIFAGQVLAIRRPDNGVVEIEFRIDHRIRGCTAGTTYMLREWAGLWAVNDQRYRVGQRLLMLLHAPSAAGMSSPIGGLDGAIPIRQGGTADSADSSANPQRPYVDLRWLGARVPRAVSYSSEAAKQLGFVTPSAAPGRILAASGLRTSAGSTVTPITGTAGVNGSVAAQQASVDAVLDMLTSWQKVRNGAP